MVTDRQTHRPSTVTLVAHARRGLMGWACSEYLEGTSHDEGRVSTHTNYILLSLAPVRLSASY